MSSVGDPRWERLTDSARAALRWAWASAVVRTAPSSHALSSQPVEVEVDSYDLLAGLMLADPPDTPPRRLAEHVGLSPGALLTRPAAGATVPGGASPATQPIDPDALLAAFRRVPPEGIPPLETLTGTAQVLAQALGEPVGPDGRVTLADLFGALLALPTVPATVGLRATLSRRGADPDAIAASYREFLGDRMPYADWLRERHPYQPPRVELPAFHPDRPPPRDAPAADSPDLVDIGPEVDAFAYLIASKRLSPPLAIGLFGEWGSGKSWFLRSIQRRVDALVTDPATTFRAPADQPFHPKIVQIEFNAWQYVEGNLWASLLEHLFRNLAPAGTDKGRYEATRQYWIEQITQTDAATAAIRRERDRLERDRQLAASAVTQLTIEREAKLAELDRRRRAHPSTPWKPKEKLVEAALAALHRAGLDVACTDGPELRAELDQASANLRGLGAVFLPLTSKRRYVFALIGAFLLLPAVAIGAESIDRSTLTSVTSGAAATLAGLTGYLTWGNRFVRKVSEDIARQQRSLDADHAAALAELDQPVATAEKELAQVDASLTKAAESEKKLVEAAAKNAEKLAEVTPARVLSDFILDRLGSEDYRRHLGLPAVVRRDLEELSDLIGRRHLPEHAPEVPSQHAIDRIVLYIDDLDRCPTHLVIDVLQAVHLLLAFPLFVVVVAVDKQWMSQALTNHYRDQFGEQADRKAAPADFLEKIFQIPFRVRPLEPEARRAMLRGLMLPSVRAKPGATGDGPMEPGKDLTEPDQMEFRRLVSSFADPGAPEAPWLEAADLTIGPDELTWIEQVVPLLPATPRAVKRFANVYLLARSMGRTRGLTLPERGQVVLLLAVHVGLPQLSEYLFREIRAAEARRSRADALQLTDVIPTSGDKPAAQAGRRLSKWLTFDMGTMRDADFAGLGDWIDLIRRFGFEPPAAEPVSPGRGSSPARP